MNPISWSPLDAPLSRLVLPKFLQPTIQYPCRLKLNFSIYFDGTRNNKEEDKPKGSHSNIAKLFELGIYDEQQCTYKLYIQGVGTRFPEIGEPELIRTAPKKAHSEIDESATPCFSLPTELPASRMAEIWSPRIRFPSPTPSKTTL